MRTHPSVFEVHRCGAVARHDELERFVEPSIEGGQTGTRCRLTYLSVQEAAQHGVAVRRRIVVKAQRKERTVDSGERLLRLRAARLNLTARPRPLISRQRGEKAYCAVISPEGRCCDAPQRAFDRDDWKRVAARGRHRELRTGSASWRGGERERAQRREPFEGQRDGVWR